MATSPARRRWIDTIWSPVLALVACACAWVGPAQTQTAPTQPGIQPSIYTCIDPKGRRITSDRPIAECMGTGQRELTPSGNLKRIVPPELTADERAREAERRREEAARQARLEEERRKNRALVARFPDQATHDKARAEALAQIDELIAAVRKREIELKRQHQEIDAELEFYRNDPARAPIWLKKLKEENDRQRASQASYLAEQLREHEQTGLRFDEELVRLRELWKQGSR